MKLNIDYSSREGLLGAKRVLEIVLAKVEGGLEVFDQKETASKMKTNEGVMEAFAGPFETLAIDFTAKDAFEAAPSMTQTQVRNAIEGLTQSGKVKLISKGAGRAPSKYQKTNAI